MYLFHYLMLCLQDMDVFAKKSPEILIRGCIKKLALKQFFAIGKPWSIPKIERVAKVSSMRLVEINRHFNQSSVVCGKQWVTWRHLARWLVEMRLWYNMFVHDIRYTNHNVLNKARRIIRNGKIDSFITNYSGFFKEPKSV